MEIKPVKAKRKKTSRGQRTHVRRMKQEARKGSIIDNAANKKARNIEIIPDKLPIGE